MGFWAKLKELLHVEDLEVIHRQIRMKNRYGYVPAYGPTLPDLNTAWDQCQWLMKDFPGWPWMVEVRRGFLQCVNPMLHSEYGFKEHVRRLDSDGRVIRRYGVGLLERFGQGPRLDEDQYLTSKRDVRGNLVLL